MKAWEKYLNELAKKPCSRPLQDYLMTLVREKEMKLEVFTQGVQAFAKIANLRPEERKTFYGDPLLGLHYSNDLARQLSQQFAETVPAYEANSICPLPWNANTEENTLGFIYEGNCPSAALDKLLRGPTTIDCGMFCELAIWFGIRNMLGNALFDETFGDLPFYVTQYIFTTVEDDEKPYDGNPLFSFFESKTSDQSTAVFMEHVTNTKYYKFKHPGGNCGGQNCIVIAGKYTIFEPSASRKIDLQKSEVEKMMLDSHNAEQDEDDKVKLKLYDEFQSAIHPHFNMNYATLSKLALRFSKHTIGMPEWKHSAVLKTPLSFCFDLDRFCSWVEQRRTWKDSAMVGQGLNFQYGMQSSPASEPSPRSQNARHTI